MRPQPDKSTLNWKFRLLGGLSRVGARRIFTTGDFYAFVEQFRPGTSESSARTLANNLIQAGALYRVSSGLYLNRRSFPPAELTEVAGHIRAGAVISLQSVLGECGFLNNPSVIVMAVVASSAFRRPNLGEVLTSGGAVFRFYGLAEKFFPKTDEERWELYQPGRHCDMFRPEVALLQWIYLARMERSRMTTPPMDVDMTALDEERLDKLAERWGLLKDLHAWLERAKAVNLGKEP